jgi:GT2 family glycosyltransferase
VSPVRRKKIVLLGMMTKIPVGGVVWNTVQYMIGFQRLGYDVYYVEEHARTPTMLMEHASDDGSARAAAFIAGVMNTFGFPGHWAYHALHDAGEYYGMSASQLNELYGSAELIINLHGGTIPRPEHSKTGRLIFLETDPVDLQIELSENRVEAIDFLTPHVAFFTWGQNYGNVDCFLPVSERFSFIPTRPPVVTDLWYPYQHGPATTFTTVGNWQQHERTLAYQGQVYTWSKHAEFMKIVDLPRRTPQPFELALGLYSDEDKRFLEAYGWTVRQARAISGDPNAYRQYIAGSRGEFTAAKDQNVRFRSGWFSERSATYLASGRPVINQDTGFSNLLPLGHGLFAYRQIDDILHSVQEINSRYDHHCRGALEVANEYFNYDVVLPPILEHMGLPHGPSNSVRPSLPTIVKSFPASMNLTPISRFPTLLPAETEKTALASRFQDGVPGYDIVCLAPVTPGQPMPWKALFDQLAQCGHRVFYLKAAAPEPGAGESLSCRKVAINVFEVEIPDTLLAQGDELPSPASQTALCSLLARIRLTHGIYTATTYAHTPGQALIALHARKLWDWRAVHAGRVQGRLQEIESDGSDTSATASRTPDAHMTWAVDNARSYSPAERVALWLARWRDVDTVIRASFPKVSIVIVVRDALLYTKLCLESLLANTEYPNYEVIVVDNGSSDGTTAYLQELARQQSTIRLLLNEHNLGFAGGTNHGLAAAAGDILVLLNNDTLVPPGMICKLAQYLQDTTVGMVGPVTNRAPNEAQIDVSYETYGEFLEFAHERAQNFCGRTRTVEMLAMHCVAITRQMYSAVGQLDEQFEIGMFEDDDYAMRVRQSGHRLLCAEDVFLHHFGQATIGKLAGSGDWGTLFATNQRRFEEKWGVPWSGHHGRAKTEYDALVDRIQQVTCAAVPPGSTVLVVSKGDDALLQLKERHGGHFPQNESGAYTGYYPQGDEDAIAHLESLRVGGAGFLLVPEPSLWWLDFYTGLRDHLEQRYELLVNDRNTCVLYALHGRAVRADTEAGATCAVANTDVP